MSQPEGLRHWSFPMGTAQLEEPALFINRMRGPGKLDGATLIGVRDALVAVASARPDTYYWLLGLDTLTGLSDEAREVLRKWPGTQTAGVVAYGGSLVFRSTIQLVHRGLSLVGRSRTGLHFVRDEAEARALVARLRAARGQALGR